MNGIRTLDILPRYNYQYQIGVLYFIFEKEQGNYTEKGAILLRRLNKYKMEDMMGVGASCVFGGLAAPYLFLSILWKVQGIHGQIFKFILIAAIVLPMGIDMFITTYLCQLYRWNKAWEEQYQDLLSQGMPAPNIETVEFPEI